MRVQQFVDEYGLVAPLYGVSPTELRGRDDRQAEEVRRWFVEEDDALIGAVVPWLRPDDRMFLRFRVVDVRAYAPLTRTVVAALGRSVSTTVDESATYDVQALLDCGFAIEMVGERFQVPFSETQALVERAWVPSGYRIRSVADADESRALALDNAIRDLVPGTDGWVGDAHWFRDELQSPEFDPSAYLIAVEESTDAYVGVIRIWRNPDGPRVGLLGVLPGHRRKPVAAALLKQALAAASTWGFDTFVTETSPSNRRTHPRLIRMNTQREGRFLQMTRT